MMPRPARVLPLLLAMLLLLAGGNAYALDGEIEAIDPPSAKQGQTVMLTIRGRDLPQGAVVLDFFPQRIQLLKILSADAQEITAQVRIPATAPAGGYNVLVYNHLGEEAFGEQMFTVDSDLVVPVISGYDPKVIAEADNGFAIVFNCDTISTEAVQHLNIEWSKGSLPLNRLETVFSPAGPDRVVAAVSGALPEGNIRGRLRFDSTPIYLVELTIRSGGAYVLGFSPAELEPGSGREMRLIGSGFTSSFLEGLTVQLLFGERSIAPQAKRVLDSNSILLEFADELSVGRHTLVVRQGEETLLLEDVNVKAGGIVSQDTQIGNPPAQQEPDSDVTQQETAPPTSTPPVATASALSPVSLSISKLEIAPGMDPARFILQGDGLEKLDADNLSYQLERSGASSQLLFSGFTNNGITCIFGPADNEWTEGERITFSVLDATNTMKPFSQQLEVTAGDPVFHDLAVLRLEPEGNRIRDSKWFIAFNSHEQGDELVQGRVAINCEDADGVDPAMLEGEFRFQPADAASQRAFSNLTMSGPLEFSGEGGSFLARFSGLFVPGDVTFYVRLDGAPVIDSTVTFDFPRPVARLGRRQEVQALVFDVDSGSFAETELMETVDLAPLQVSDPSFLSGSLMPAPLLTTQDVSVVAQGSSVQVSVPTGTWEEGTEFGAGLMLELASSIDLEWGNGNTVIYPVTVNDPGDAISASIPRRPVVIDEDSFRITIIPHGNNAMSADWTRVKLDSDNILLNSNIDSFAVSMESADFVGQPAISLVFRRGRGLGMEAFEVLAQELVSAGEVRLTLSWDSLGFTEEEILRFVR